MTEGLSGEEFRTIATFLGVFIAAGYTAYLGNKKGRPTSAATAAAIQSASCRAADVLPNVKALERQNERLIEEVEELGQVVEAARSEVRGLRDILIRIEDRTSR